MRLATTLTALLMLLAGVCAAGAQGFGMRVVPDADGLALRFEVPPGARLYRERVAVRSAGGRELPLALPPGRAVDDVEVGSVHVFDAPTEGRLSVADVAAAAAEGPVSVTYQGCRSDGICLRAVTETFEPASYGIVPAASAGTMPEPASPEAVLDGASLPGVLLAFLAFGLGLSLTPCVLPMYPVLAGMIVRERAGTGRAASLASAYVLGMSCAFGAAGAAIALTGAGLQDALRSPVALAGMAVLFVLLSLSTFGVLPAPRLEVLLPGRRRAGLAGAFGMGASSALILGPCVTAPLAAALLFVARSGDAATGCAALFALGIGKGVPLVAFAAFGGRVLPRAGAWMEQVRKVFGLVFLGLALLVAAPLAPASVVLAGWGVLLLAAGALVVPLAVRTRGPGRAASLAGVLAAAAGGMTLVVGASIGAVDVRHPLTPDASAAGPFRVLADVGALEGFVATGRPSVILVTADWCAACGSLKRGVLAEPEVEARLAAGRFAEVRLGDGGAGDREVERRLDVVGPPSLLFMGPDGKEVRGLRLTGEFGKAALLRRLDAVDGAKAGG